MPLLLYSPPHAKVRPTLERLRALADRVPTLVASSCRAVTLPGMHGCRRCSATCRCVREPGHALGTGLAAGAAGSYSNVAALNPVAARAAT